MMLVNGSGPLSARIMIIGEAPGENEARLGRPFVGASGFELDKMLGEAMINRQECRLTNVFKVRPPDNNIKHFLDLRKKCPGADWTLHSGAWVRSDRYPDVTALYEEINRVNPNIIIPVGSTPSWALLGPGRPISKTRGFIHTYKDARQYKVLPTYHPAAVLHDWTDRPIVVHDLKRARRESLSPDIIERPESFLVRPTYATALDYLRECGGRASRGPLKLSVDIETRDGFISCLGLASDRINAICIPFASTSSPSGYWEPEQEREVKLALRALLTHPNAQVIGQNFIFDTQYIFNECFFIPRVYADTMFQQHAMFPNLRKGLDFLVTMYADQPRMWKEDGKLWDTSMPEEQQWTYNARDCSYTFEVHEVMEEILRKLGKLPQWEFLQSLFYPVLKTVLRGVAIDEPLRGAFSAELGERATNLLARLEYICGHELNARSFLQVKQFFYEDLGMKPIRKRGANGEAGALTVDDDALTTLAIRNPIVKPIVDSILDLRSIGLYRKNYIDARLSEDRRIRTQFNIQGTSTYRFSSTKNVFGGGANLQNVARTQSRVADFLKTSRDPLPRQCLPFKDKDIDDAIDAGYIVEQADGLLRYRFALPPIRDLFIPDPGFALLEIDLKGADAQVVAWEADDPLLKQMFREGADVHSENAKLIGLPRQAAKVFIHGTNYGGKARTMAVACGMTVHAAELAQSRWFAEHPSIRAWHSRISMALANGRPISNKFGFSITFYDRPGSADAFGQALAWSPQSTVGLTINQVLLNIERDLPAAQILLQVHDSLLLQVPLDQCPAIFERALGLAQVVVPYDDPLIIPLEAKASRTSWGACEDISGWQ